MKYFILFLSLFITLSTNVRADVGIDLIASDAKNLGYKGIGYGIQLDADGNFNKNWGWDAQATFLEHPKFNATGGERYQTIIMGRRFFGNVFVEAGGEYGGYYSRFTEDRFYFKHGWSPGTGIGFAPDNGSEWTVRYFGPDSSPNNTSVVSASVEFPLPVENLRIGFTVERWDFKSAGKNLDGVQSMFELGWRF